MAVLVYIAIAVIPTATLWAALWIGRWFANWAQSHQPPPTPPDLKRLVNDLHRLEAEYVRIESSDTPAKAARLRAVSLAYDDTLRDCCQALGLPQPTERPLTGLARLETEAELAQHGLVW